MVIDPFNDGALVANEQLVALLVRASKSGSQVTAAQAGPMSNRDILVRLLINQASRAEQAGDTGRAMTLYQRMSLVAPSNPVAGEAATAGGPDRPCAREPRRDAGGHAGQGAPRRHCGDAGRDLRDLSQRATLMLSVPAPRRSANRNDAVGEELWKSVPRR